MRNGLCVKLGHISSVVVCLVFILKFPFIIHMPAAKVNNSSTSHESSMAPNSHMARVKARMAKFMKELEEARKRDEEEKRKEEWQRKRCN